MEEESLEKLSALAHPRRLAVYRLLMRRFPDAVPAGEIAEALSLPASSLSAALAQLRSAGLISQERRGTSLRYSADTKGAGTLIAYLSAECLRGRHDFGEGLPPDRLPARDDGAPFRVLFLSSRNACRSIMAESLLRDRADGRFEAYSAGLMPQGTVDPRTLDLLRRKGHDVSGLSSKTPQFLRSPDAPDMHFAFTLCNRAANEDCPSWPGQPVSCHWGLPNPSTTRGTDEAIEAAYEAVYEALALRIDRFLALPFDRLARAALQTGLDEIAMKERWA